MPAKALDQVLAAVKHFQQASQPLQKPAAAAVAPGEKSPLAQDGLSPRLWLLCRVQVSVISHNMLQLVTLHATYEMQDIVPWDLTYDKQTTCGTPGHMAVRRSRSALVVSEIPSQHLRLSTTVPHRL